MSDMRIQMFFSSDHDFNSLILSTFPVD